MKKVSSGRFIALLVLAAACTSLPQDDLETKVQSWVGTRQGDIEQYWGEADESLEIGEGMRVLQYNAEDEGADYPCVVIFSINRYGFVLGSKWNGDRQSCQSFVQALPAEHQNLLKETNLVILEAIGNVQKK